jgi:lipopolysaccharide biosynthesis regulator YciM
MAGALRAEGRHDEARRTLRKALRGDKQLVRGWILLGEIEAEQGRTKQAIDAWRRVPDLDRRAAGGVYQRLEAVYEKLGRGAELERFLEARLEGDSDEVEARLALARLLLARGAVNEAKTHVRRVLEREPDRLDAHAALGRVLLTEPREPELAKQLGELLDVLERQGLLRQREDSR